MKNKKCPSPSGRIRRRAGVRTILLMAILLEFPLTIVQGAHLSCLEPTRNAVKVEGMIANAPGHMTLLRCGRRLVGLTLDAQVHDVITTNGTIVHHNVPGPQGNGGPLLHLEPLATMYGLRGRGGHLSIVQIIARFHINIINFVGHPEQKRGY